MIERQQEIPLFESWNDALRDAVRALGGTKKVAHILKHDLPLASAISWLDGCLNETRREHLTPEQLVWLAREARAVGCHSINQFFNLETGYEIPKPKNAEELKADLQQQFIAAVAAAERISLRLREFKEV